MDIRPTSNPDVALIDGKLYQKVRYTDGVQAEPCGCCVTEKVLYILYEYEGKKPEWEKANG